MKSYILNNTHIKILEKKDKPYNSIYFKKHYDVSVKYKNGIDMYGKKWEKQKKSMNDYEYVYTKYNIYSNICSILPISRSYFKLHEMCTDYNITNITRCTCIAEGPGGFIQYLYNTNVTDIYGITLISKNKNIPTWSYKIYDKPNIHLLDGDGSGDICKYDNIMYFIDNIGKNNCDLITCDGGIDYSNNFTNQECESYNFIYNEILLALNLQSKGGTLILKIFDIFNTDTINLIYLLYNVYDTITLCKPCTSRNTNSEKYLVCKNYNYDKNIINLLFDNFVEKKLNIYIPKSFFDDLKYYNDIYCEVQNDNIQNVLNILKSNNIYINKPNKNQILKAKEWCKKYNLPINKKCIYL